MNRSFYTLNLYMFFNSAKSTYSIYSVYVCVYVSMFNVYVCGQCCGTKSCIGASRSLFIRGRFNFQGWQKQSKKLPQFQRLPPIPLILFLIAWGAYALMPHGWGSRHTSVSLHIFIYLYTLKQNHIIVMISASSGSVLYFEGSGQKI